jgi:hypothetical protein
VVPYTSQSREFARLSYHNPTGEPTFPILRFTVHNEAGNDELATEVTILTLTCPGRSQTRKRVQASPSPATRGKAYNLGRPSPKHNTLYTGNTQTPQRRLRLSASHKTPHTTQPVVFSTPAPITRSIYHTCYPHSLSTSPSARERTDILAPQRAISHLHHIAPKPDSTASSQTNISMRYRVSLGVAPPIHEKSQHRGVLPLASIPDSDLCLTC